MNREQEIKSIKESQLKLADEQRKLADRLEALEKPEALKEGSIIETSDGYLAIIGRDAIIWLNKEVAFLSDKLPESGLHLANGSTRLGTFDEVFVMKKDYLKKETIQFVIALGLDLGTDGGLHPQTLNWLKERIDKI